MPEQDELPEQSDPRMLRRFAQVIAHELRNPLSAVKIALQSMGRQAEIPPKQATRLGIALREVDTIERVLTEVLDWARPSVPRPLPLPAEDLLASAVEFAQADLRDRRVSLRRGECVSGSRVRVDHEQTARAFAELLRNAAQASAAESEVILEITRADDDVLLSVVDGGRGVTEQDMPLVFEPFFTRRARGIGLGLTRARQTARRHGGDVFLESVPGGGIRATLRLPSG